MIAALITSFALTLAALDDARIESMLDDLARAPDASAAADLESKIVEAWLDSGSPSIDLLMSRGIEAEAQGDYALARRMYDAVTDLAPDFAEGWRRRAMVYLEQDDLSAAVSDLERTLDLEDRHFAALMTLGGVFEALGAPDGAFNAYQRAHQIHPYLEAATAALARLRPDVTGRDT